MKEQVIFLLIIILLLVIFYYIIEINYNEKYIDLGDETDKGIQASAYQNIISTTPTLAAITSNLGSTSNALDTIISEQDDIISKIKLAMFTDRHKKDARKPIKDILK